MELDYQLNKFTELRFDYYSAGRTLWFNDNMETAAILLGHAVELSFKQILVVSGNDSKNRKLMERHNILDLYQKANEVALNQAVPITEDLLHFISDRLHQRYPRQVVEANKQAEKRGHATCLLLDVIHSYDDLIISLDEWLRIKYPTKKLSVGIMASHFVNRVTGRAIFHCNSAALSRTTIYQTTLTEEYTNAENNMKAENLNNSTIQYNLKNQKERLKSWETAPNGLWLASNLTTSLGECFTGIPENRLAKNFKYPGIFKKFY